MLTRANAGWPTTPLSGDARCIGIVEPLAALPRNGVELRGSVPEWVFGEAMTIVCSSPASSEARSVATCTVLASTPSHPTGRIGSRRSAREVGARQ
jgi:hypothetical protein